MVVSLFFYNFISSSTQLRNARQATTRQ